MNVDNILVTGGDGFIGSNLIRELLKDNYKVSTTSRKPLEETSLRDLRGRIDFHKLDLTNENHVTKLIKKVNPNVIIHLASIINKKNDPSSLNDSMKNIQMSLNIYNSSLKLENLHIIINFGTAEEYSNNISPLTENQIGIAVSPYSLSKIQINKLSTYFHKIHNLPVVTLRPFLVYGENQSPTMIIPYIITQGLKNNQIKTTPGEQTRDFIYVKDLTSAIIRVIEIPKKELLGETINICSSKEITVREVIEKIKQLTNSNSKINFNIPYRKNEAMRFFGSNEKAKKLLKWEPSYPIEEGLKRTVNWYKNNMDSWKN